MNENSQASSIMLMLLFDKLRPQEHQINADAAPQTSVYVCGAYVAADPISGKLLDSFAMPVHVLQLTE